MGIEELLLDRAKNEGLVKGKAVGKTIGAIEKSREVVANLITKLGLSDEQAAEVAEVSIVFVKKVRKELVFKK